MADHKKPKEEEKKLDAHAAEGAEGAEGVAKKKSKKKLIIIVAAAVLLLGGGGAAFMLMSGGADKKAAKSKKSDSEESASAKEGEQGGEVELGEDGKPVPTKTVYYDLPDIVVNLSSPTPRPHFVNLKLTLEVKNAKAVQQVENEKPRIIDSFNTYLREVRQEDIQGSAGLYRLEKELQLRLDKVLGEGTVKDILFREIIVQ